MTAQPPRNRFCEAVSQQQQRAQAWRALQRRGRGEEAKRRSSAVGGDELFGHRGGEEPYSAALCMTLARPEVRQRQLTNDAVGGR